jgi:hypothetical protein
MKALNRNAASMALALNRDAFGNLWSGQEERAFGFLKLSIRLLAAIETDAKEKSLKSEKALEATLAEVTAAADVLEPKFNGELAGEANAKWTARGITPNESLVSIDHTTLDKDHPVRQWIENKLASQA